MKEIKKVAEVIRKGGLVALKFLLERAKRKEKKLDSCYSLPELREREITKWWKRFLLKAIW